jgi:MarR family transcriptional regulator, lower aerobic nicotinate degradation pathway regulator
MSAKTDQAGKSAEPQYRLGFMLYRSGLAVARGYERALKPVDASPTDAGVLSSLAYTGPSHTRALGRLLGLGRQTIVNVTKRLEESDLIKRDISERDSRLVMFAITPAGRTRLSEIERIASRFDTQLRHVVGADNEQDLIRKLQLVLEAPFLAYEE